MLPLPELESLLREIEPTLASSAVYLLDAAEYETLERPCDVLAWTGFLADIQARPALQERGLWRGPGFATVVYLDRLMRSADQLTAIVLHELAHWLTFPERPAEYANLEPETAIEWVAMATQAADQSIETDLPWRHHEPPFVRAACHLAYRAAKLRAVRLDYMAFSRQYYDVGESVWMRTLESELQPLQSRSIREILTIEPPKAFTDLSHILTGWLSKEPPSVANGSPSDSHLPG